MKITKLYAGGEIVALDISGKTIEMKQIIEKGYEAIYKEDFIKNSPITREGTFSIGELEKELEKKFEKLADGCNVVFRKGTDETKLYSLMDLINFKIVEI